MPNGARKGFTSGGQFLAMQFCQFVRAHSLREICGGLAGCVLVTTSFLLSRQSGAKLWIVFFFETAIKCEPVGGGRT
jgi:uncharacterized membrane protein YdcZ (DUF606 family)